MIAVFVPPWSVVNATRSFCYLQNHETLAQLSESRIACSSLGGGRAGESQCNPVCV